MRRRILLLMSCVLVALSVCGCARVDPVYDTLNGLKEIGYASIVLDVTTEVDGDTLKGNYRAVAAEGGYRVEYSFEQLSEFGESGGDFVIPTDRKTKYRGTMSVIDGEITSQTGTESDVPIGLITARGLNFSAGNFADAVIEEGLFDAKVVQTEAFFGREVSTETMTVHVIYSTEALKSLTVTYSLGGTEVSLVYRFTAKN